MMSRETPRLVRRLRAALAIALAGGYATVVGWACGNDYSAVERPADGAAAPDGSAATPVESACKNPANRCLAIPPSWSGPYTLTNAACGGERPNTVLEKLAFDAAPATCGCACTVPGRCSYRASIATGASCSTPPNTPYNSNSCGGTSGGGGPLRFFVSVDRDANASCTVTKSGGKADVPDAANIRICGATTNPEREDCGAGEICAAPRSCIMATGNLACPPGFAARSVVYDSIDDQGTCTGACGCTTTAPPDCTSPEVRVTGVFPGQLDECTDVDATTAPLDTCVTISSTSIYYAYLGDASPGTCTTTYDGGPSGTLVTTGPTTVCCDQ